MSEVSNRFSEWKNWVQENLEGLFWTKFEPLPPESYRAFPASHSECDVIGSIRESRAAAGGSSPHATRLVRRGQELPACCDSPFQDPHDAPLEDTGPLHRELKRFGAGNWRMRHRFNNFGSFVS